MLLEEFSETLQKVLYSVITLCILFFFYKIYRKPAKNFGLLMILILLVTLFGHAILQLLAFFGRSSDLLNHITEVLNNFASLWIISLGVYHYSLLTFFMGKFREYPFKTFIIRAGLGSLSIAIITELPYVQEWNASFYLIDVLSVFVFLFISFRTYNFRDQIKFGPYSIVRESAYSLIKFALIQTCFAILEILINFFSYYKNCDNPQNQNQNVYCVASNLGQLTLYQSWVWYVVYFNWKWIRAFGSRESENSSANISSDLNNSISSAAFMESNI